MHLVREERRLGNTAEEQELACEERGDPREEHLHAAPGARAQADNFADGVVHVVCSGRREQDRVLHNADH